MHSEKRWLSEKACCNGMEMKMQKQVWKWDFQLTGQHWAAALLKHNPSFTSAYHGHRSYWLQKSNSKIFLYFSTQQQKLKHPIRSPLRVSIARKQFVILSANVATKNQTLQQQLKHSVWSHSKPALTLILHLKPSAKWDRDWEKIHKSDPQRGKYLVTKQVLTETIPILPQGLSLLRNTDTNSESWEVTQPFSEKQGSTVSVFPVCPVPAPTSTREPDWFSCTVLPSPH